MRCSQSWPTSTARPPTARGIPRDALEPFVLHVGVLRVKTCLSCSWLHLLKGWSFHDFRGGSSCLVQSHSRDFPFLTFTLKTQAQVMGPAGPAELPAAPRVALSHSLFQGLLVLMKSTLSTTSWAASAAAVTPRLRVALKATFKATLKSALITTLAIAAVAQAQAPSAPTATAELPLFAIEITVRSA